VALIIPQEEVFCTSYVAAHYLKHSLKLQGKVYLLGMPGFAHELDLQGIHYTGPGVSPVLCNCSRHCSRLTCGLLQEDPVLATTAELLETPLDPEVGSSLPYLLRIYISLNRSGQW
jgi:ribonucleotide monophosphatase NagD (HAD superfamily)